MKQITLLMEAILAMIPVTALVFLDTLVTNAKMSVQPVLFQTLKVVPIIHVIVWQDIMEKPVKIHATNVMLLMLKLVMV